MTNLGLPHWRPSVFVRSFLGSQTWRVPLVRYAAPVLVDALIITSVLAPSATRIAEGWLQRDASQRASLVFRSIADQLVANIVEKPELDFKSFIERLAQHEGIHAIGYCTDDGQLRYATGQIPGAVTCENIKSEQNYSFVTAAHANKRIHVTALPLGIGNSSGRLLILHDLSDMDEWTRSAWRIAVLFLVVAFLGFGLASAASMLGFKRTWVSSIRGVMIDAQGARVEAASPPRPEFPGGREMQAKFDALRLEQPLANSIHVEWSPETLHRLLREELPGAEVLAVSNREPYIHNYANGEIELQIPASGLVAAIEPVMRACGGTWIAHGSGSADRETVDGNDRLRVPPANPTYSLRRVWLTDEENEGYYYGLANEGLWPLCHVAFVRPTFRQSDWACYVEINERFADAVVEEATTDEPIVLVQDYHFALLPRMIRNRLPKATIITFWHIPWPNAETFGICPWRKEIIEGLLGSSILGFHTQFHCNNFIEGIDRFMESRIDRERASVTFGGHETLVRPYPISIEWPPAGLAEQAPVQECRTSVCQRYSLPADARIAVGVERFDYTKGILERIRAIDDLLTREAEWRGKLVFIQAVAPTRSKLDAYSSLQKDVVQLADEVNARHGNDGYKPILLSVRHHQRAEVYELLRAADICIVSSLHDGMNLVAKEFVAARDDEQGVLILSWFAGASRELFEALIINPYDTFGMAEALATALNMPTEEQRERMHLMRDFVRHRNVYRWAAQMLLDAARLRQRERVVEGQHP